MNQESRNTGKSGTHCPQRVVAGPETHRLAKICGCRSYIPVFLIDLYV